MSDAEQIPVKGFCSAVLLHRKIEVVLPALFRHRKVRVGTRACRQKPNHLYW